MKKKLKKNETLVSYLGVDEIFVEWYECDNCKCSMIYHNAKYCPECGEKIIWPIAQTVEW